MISNTNENTIYKWDSEKKSSDLYPEITNAVKQQ